MAQPRQRQRLKDRRRAAGYSQERLAEQVGVSVSTVRDWEQGRRLPRDDTRPALAAAYGISLVELDAILGDEGATPNGQHVPRWLGHLGALEQGAAEIRAWEPYVIHGLLQTPGYAAAVERRAPTLVSDGAIRQKVQIRLARQGVLRRDPEPLRLRLVLDESVLLRPAGGPQVMAEQLAHLVDQAQADNVDLRILPLTAETFSAAFGAFWLLTSPGSDDPYMVCLEDRAGPHYLDRPPELAAHVPLFDQLADAALPPGESVELIQRTSKEQYR